MFHFYCEGGFVYMCIADESFGRRLPFSFLNDIKERFVTSFRERGRNAIAYGLNREFAPILKQQMEYYSKDPSADPYRSVQNDIAQVKDVMVQNIDKVLQRGEHIEMLVDKTEALNEHAVVFKRKATQLKRVMVRTRGVAPRPALMWHPAPRRAQWWKNVKFMLVLLFVVGLIILFIVLFATHKIG